MKKEMTVKWGLKTSICVFASTSLTIFASASFSLFIHLPIGGTFRVKYGREAGGRKQTDYIRMWSRQYKEVDEDEGGEKERCSTEGGRERECAVKKKRVLG